MQDNEEEPVPSARKPPPGPTVEGLNKHDLTHVVFRSWCRHCFGQGKWKIHIDALQHMRVGHQRSCWTGCSSQVIKSRVLHTDTSPDARTRTLLSCVTPAHFTCALRLAQGDKRSAFGSSCFDVVVVSSSLSASRSFPKHSVLTCSTCLSTVTALYVDGTKVGVIPQAHPLAGGGLADWRLRPQTQVMSPTSTATSTVSTRRCTSLTATTISCAHATPHWFAQVQEACPSCSIRSCCGFVGAISDGHWLDWVER